MLLQCLASKWLCQINISFSDQKPSTWSNNTWLGITYITPTEVDSTDRSDSAVQPLHELRN